MANIPPIQVKRSETLGARPTQWDLEVGELAVNTADSRIFTKDSGGNIVSLGWNFHTGPDSDALYYVDSEGQVYATGYPEADYTIVAKTAGNENWQNAEPMRNAKPGTKINVFRQADGGDMWTMDRKVNTDVGWDGVISNDGIVILNYAGDAAYAMTPFWYNNTYRLQRAYVSGADHATFGQLNDYWIWQVFATPVDIGNGTALGTFQNGRGAENSTTEYFANTRITFYDADHNILADQEFTHTATTTNTINVTGNIVGCKTIEMRGHNGNNFNPAYNDINFYVNGSTAYPTATSVTDNKWGGGFKNVVGGTNLSDSDEVFCLTHVMTTAATLVGGAWNTFRTNDWCLNGNTDPNNQTHVFWLNRPWDIGGGTFSNHRVPYPGDWWQETDIEYYNSNDSEVYNRNLSMPVASTLNQLPPFRDINKIIMIPGTRNQNHPTIQAWYPNLGYSATSITLNATAIAEPEVWIKGSSAPADAFIDGVGVTKAWYKIGEVVT